MTTCRNRSDLFRIKSANHQRWRMYYPQQIAILDLGSCSGAPRATHQAIAGSGLNPTLQMRSRTQATMDLLSPRRRRIIHVNGLGLSARRWNPTLLGLVCRRVRRLRLKRIKNDSRWMTYLTPFLNAPCQSIEAVDFLRPVPSVYAPSMRFVRTSGAVSAVMSTARPLGGSRYVWNFVSATQSAATGL